MEQTANFHLQLKAILDYWSQVVYDERRKRFYGRVDEDDQPQADAPLGSVMYARILWAFSAGYQLTKDPLYLQRAHTAYRYLTTVFWDDHHGGIYWSVDASEQPLEDKKQIYALAFAIYGLSEYYKVNADRNVLERACLLYKMIEKKSYDPQHGGYLEAFRRDWTNADDLRLSEKDNNDKKTMNTHLHIMEAYVNLYSVFPDTVLRERITELIDLFRHRFVKSPGYHLTLFFDEKWQSTSDSISYGHDIEASWLLLEAAEAINDQDQIAAIKTIAVAMTSAVEEGLDEDGGLCYEYEPAAMHLIGEKHWWVQAEAAVGFLNTWQITGKLKYYHLFEHTWDFIEKHIILAGREWVWGTNADGTIMQDQDMAGIWKCPYHNTRCLLEIIKRTKIK